MPSIVMACQNRISNNSSHLIPQDQFFHRIVIRITRVAPAGSTPHTQPQWTIVTNESRAAAVQSTPPVMSSHWVAALSGAVVSAAECPTLSKEYLRSPTFTISKLLGNNKKMCRTSCSKIRRRWSPWRPRRTFSRMRMTKLSFRRCLGSMRPADPKSLKVRTGGSASWTGGTRWRPLLTTRRKRNSSFTTARRLR